MVGATNDNDIASALTHALISIRRMEKLDVCGCATKAQLKLNKIKLFPGKKNKNVQIITNIFCRRCARIQINIFDCLDIFCMAQCECVFVLVLVLVAWIYDGTKRRGRRWVGEYYQLVGTESLVVGHCLPQRNAARPAHTNGHYVDCSSLWVSAFKNENFRRIIRNEQSNAERTKESRNEEKFIFLFLLSAVAVIPACCLQPPFV